MENLWNRLLTLIDQNQLVNLLGKTILSLLVLAVFIVLGRVLRNALKRVVGRTSRNANLPILLSNLVYVAMIIIAVLAILSIYTGAGLSTLLTLLAWSVWQSACPSRIFSKTSCRGSTPARTAFQYRRPDQGAGRGGTGRKYRNSDHPASYR